MDIYKWNMMEFNKQIKEFFKYRSAGHKFYLSGCKFESWKKA